MRIARLRRALVSSAILTALLPLSLDLSLGQIVDRKREPVVVRATNDLLPDFVDDGFATSSFEVWRYYNGVWEIVPFQIDELSDIPRNVLAHQYIERLCRSIGPPINPTGPCEFEYELRGTADPGGSFSKNDEIVFLAGATGSCDAPTWSWPNADRATTRYKLRLSDYDPATQIDEAGCVYLYRRLVGSRPPLPDLVEYDTTGDGTAHAGGCIPTAIACGALKSAAADVDLDSTPDVPAWRWDFLGNWAVDKWFIGETSVSSSENMVDLIKYRITNPAETEGNWDMRSGFNLGCTTFYGYIDGPVRVIRKIGGAASGVLTTKYEVAYPGEVRTIINVRVHDVGGTVYAYPDLLQANVSSGTVKAKVYKKNFTSTAFDEVDGVQTQNPFGYGEWYQVSSEKGSFLRIDGPHRHPTALNTGGAYNDQATPLWTNVAEAVEYDIDEVGDRAAARTTITDICDTQSLGACGADRSWPGYDPDLSLMRLEAAYVMLSAASAGSTAGENVIADRKRGELALTAVKEVRDDPPSPPPVFCSPTLQALYADDGGPVDLQASLSACSNIAGWALYMGAGAGVYRRLGTLPLGVSFRDAPLELNEQRTYFAAAIGNNGVHGPLSQGLVFVHGDTVAPAAPADVSATADIGQITVTWTRPADADVERFKIYASTTSGGPYNLVDGGSNSHCKDSRTVTASSGTYYLIVKAVDFAGNHSLASNQAVVTVP